MNPSQRMSGVLGPLLVSLVLLPTLLARAAAPTLPMTIGIAERGPGLDGFTASGVSPDGRHVYFGSFSGSLRYFARDPASSALKLLGGASGYPYVGLTHLQVSRCGRYVVTTAGGRGMVVLFTRDAATGKLSQLHRIDADSNSELAGWQPRESAFSPDSQFVFTVDERGRILSFRIHGEDQFALAGQLSEPASLLAGANGIAMHPDGETVLVVSPRSKALFVLDRNSTSRDLTVRHHLTDAQSSLQGLAGAVAMAFSPDGRFVYLNSGDRRGEYAISVFQLSSSGRIRLIQEYFDDEERLRNTLIGNDLVVSPDGRHLYVCCMRKDKLIRLERNRETGRLGQPQSVSLAQDAPPLWMTCLSISPDSRQLFAATELSSAILTVRVNDAPAGDASIASAPIPAAVGTSLAQGTLPPFPTRPVDAAAPDPTAARSTHSGDAGEVARMTGHQRVVNDVAFSPDGRLAASGSSDETVKIWNIPDGTLLRTLSGETRSIASIAWSPDGRMLATGGVDNLIRLWDPHSGQERGQLKGPDRSISGLAFSPDGQRLLSAAGDRKVRLWDVASGQELKVFDQEMEVMRRVAISSDGRLALCCGAYFNNTDTPMGEILRVWNLETGEVVFRLKPPVRGGITCAAFSPDSRRVSACDLGARRGSQQIGIWELENGTQAHSVTSPGSPLDLAFSSSGRHLLSSHIDRLVLLDYMTGRTVKEYRGHTGPVTAVAISPDARYALSGSTDKSVRLWRLPEISTVVAAPAEEVKTTDRDGPDKPAEAVERPDRAPSGKPVEQRRDAGPAPIAPPSAGSRAFLSSPSPEVQKSLQTIGQAQRQITNLEMLLHAYPAEGADEQKQLHRDFSQAQSDLGRAAERMSEMGSAALGRFRKRFEKLPLLTQQQWRFGAANGSIAAEVPAGISVAREDGKAIIGKQHSPQAIHACLDHPLTDGARIRIQFSLGRRDGARGGPVQYIGLREEEDDEAQQIIFPFFANNPDEVHEVLIERQGSRYTALHKDVVKGAGDGQTALFQTPPRLLFVLNGEPEVVIHAVHATTPEGEPN